MKASWLRPSADDILVSLRVDFMVIPASYILFFSAVLFFVAENDKITLQLIPFSGQRNNVFLRSLVTGYRKGYIHISSLTQKGNFLWWKGQQEEQHLAWEAENNIRDSCFEVFQASPLPISAGFLCFPSWVYIILDQPFLHQVSL